MRSILAVRYGGPEVLQLLDRPAPTPAATEVAIDVSHAAVGLIDVLIRRGAFADYDLLMKAPFVPGIEVAGTVRAVGEQVTSHKVGDRVSTLSIASGGGYAEVMVAPAELTILLPDGVGSAQAVAALPNATTAQLALTRAAGVPQGGRVLVHGAAGALASVFPPIARRLGASEVVGTVRSADRIAEAEALGFDRVVVSEDLLGVDSHERFDIIVDPVGGVQRPELLELLAQMGRLIAVGSADSRSGKAVDTNDLWFNNTGIVGFSVGNFLAENPAAAAVSAADALEVIAEGSINLQISTYPLERAADAHARMEAGAVSGRLVLDV